MSDVAGMLPSVSSQFGDSHSNDVTTQPVDDLQPMDFSQSLDNTVNSSMNQDAGVVVDVGHQTSFDFLNPALPSFSEDHFKDVRLEIPKLTKMSTKIRARPRKRPSSPHCMTSPLASPNVSASSFKSECATTENGETAELKKPKTEWTPPEIRFRKTREYAAPKGLRAQVFYPTLEEMTDFTCYLQKIEAEFGPHISCGICKIVPPKGWTPRPSKGNDYSDIDDILIHHPVKETIEALYGFEGEAFQKTNRVYKKCMTGREFREMAARPAYNTPARVHTIDQLEKHYWKNVLKGEPIYGADTPGTLYEDCVDVFNITKLNTILDLLNEENVKIKGVNTPYLYFGMYKTTFPWHVEDMDLYSINYVHYGEPKFWYGIPSESADKFERLVSQLVPREGPSLCKGFLRHKVYMISPPMLDKYGIPYGTMVQYPGEFVVTFPRGYHMGFNTGFNVAEATNFAIDRWIDYGKNTVLCNCSSDRVEINMSSFVEKYRPDEFESWHNFWYINRPSINASELKRKMTAYRLNQLCPHLSLEHRLATLSFAEQYLKAERRRRMDRPMFDYAPDFDYECSYNRKQGKIFPNCAVCTYLVPDLDLGFGEEMACNKVDASPRYVVDQLFLKEPDEKSENLTTPAAMSEIDELIECASCKVVVHKKCYTHLPANNGIKSDYYSQNMKNGKWECFRCIDRSLELVEKTTCHLCSMRGGAMIPALTGGQSDNEFVHLICAVAHRRTKFLMTPACVFAFTMATQKIYTDKVKHDSFDDFVNPYNVDMDPRYLAAPSTFIMTSKILQCELCGNNSEGLHACCLCIDDPHPRYFHVTCAKLLDIVFERRNFPVLLAPVCIAHKAEPPECYLDEKTTEYQEAVIVKKFAGQEVELRGGMGMRLLKNKWAVVDFFDGSVSNDIVTDEICECECNEKACDKVNHIYSSLMRVEWEAGKFFLGYFRGMRKEFEYQIDLDEPYVDAEGIEHETVVVKADDWVRKDIYRRKRGRPKKNTPTKEATVIEETIAVPKEKVQSP